MSKTIWSLLFIMAVVLLCFLTCGKKKTAEFSAEDWRLFDQAIAKGRWSQADKLACQLDSLGYSRVGFARQRGDIRRDYYNDYLSALSLYRKELKEYRDDMSVSASDSLYLRLAETSYLIGVANHHLFNLSVNLNRHYYQMLILAEERLDRMAVDPNDSLRRLAASIPRRNRRLIEFLWGLEEFWSGDYQQASRHWDKIPADSPYNEWTKWLNKAAINPAAAETVGAAPAAVQYAVVNSSLKHPQGAGIDFSLPIGGIKSAAFPGEETLLTIEEAAFSARNGGNPNLDSLINSIQRAPRIIDARWGSDSTKSTWYFYSRKYEALGDLYFSLALRYLKEIKRPSDFEDPSYSDLIAALCEGWLGNFEQAAKIFDSLATLEPNAEWKTKYHAYAAIFRGKLERNAEVWASRIKELGAQKGAAPDEIAKLSAMLKAHQNIPALINRSYNVRDGLHSPNLGQALFLCGLAEENEDAVHSARRMLEDARESSRGFTLQSAPPPVLAVEASIFFNRYEFLFSFLTLQAFEAGYPETEDILDIMRRILRQYDDIKEEPQRGGFSIRWRDMALHPRRFLNVSFP